MEQNRKPLIRMITVFMLLAIAGGGMLVYGFVKTQAVEGEYWRERSKERRVTTLREPARRGDIMSSDGKTLATTIMVCDLYVDLGYREVKDNDNVTQRDSKRRAVRDTTIRDQAFYQELDTVCRLIHEAVPKLSVEELKRKIRAERAKKRPSQCMLIARNIPYTSWLQLLQVKGWRRGIIQQVDGEDVRHQMRIRIYDNLGGNVIGFRNGLLERYTGLEGYYDSILRGQDGIYESRRLTRGTWLPDIAIQEKIDGTGIVATIDSRFQDIADQALRQALADRNATSGCAVLMEVETGYVVACANLCLDSATRHLRESIDHNVACADLLQPGSTFKPVVVAAVMSDDSVRLDTAIRLRARVKNFDGTPEGELTDEHAIGDTISLTQAIVHSSNVALADLGWKYYRQRRSGLVENVRHVFPSEMLNLDLRTPEYGQRINTLRYNRDFLNFCFGYSTAVSPMQLLTFYNAIAANGRMVKPLFCRQVGSTKIRPVVMNEHAMNRRTAEYLQEALARVVSEGTATSIRNTSYGIAGKTGTAKVRPTGFSPNDAFFVGFFPAERPKYSCIVLIRNTFSSGGAAAAPVFKRVADGVMALDKDLGKIRMEQIEWNTPEASRQPMNVKGYRSEIAEFYDQLDLKFPMADSAYRWVTYQEQYQPYSPRTTIMPNCKGMTAKDAIRLLDELGVRTRFSGCGRVVQQEPKARTPIKPGNTAYLTLSY